MILILCNVLSWIVWVVLADKRRWREIFPVSMFASFLAMLTDHIMEDGYRLWDYHGAHPLVATLFDDLGIYFVVTYLYIQWLPKNRSALNMFKYTSIWAGTAIIIEFTHIATGYMEHHGWWTPGHSYIADWILFILFYKFYKAFGFHRLSTDDVKLESKIENLGDIVFTLDRDGKVIDCHSKWLKEKNFNPISIIGKTIQAKKDIKDIEVHTNSYSKALRGEEVCFEWEWTNLNGEDYYFKTQIAPYKNYKGEVVGLIGISTEISKEQVYNPVNLIF